MHVCAFLRTNLILLWSSLCTPPHPQVQWHTTLRILCATQTLALSQHHLLSQCVKSCSLRQRDGQIGSLVGQVVEDIDAKKDVDQILVIQSARHPFNSNLLRITRSLLILVYLCYLFMSWWIQANLSIDQLQRAGEKYREDGICGNCSGLCDRFVDQLVTWNVRMFWNSLNVNGRRNGTDGFMNGICTRIR